MAEKGFPISVYNRSYEKTEAAVNRASKEGARTRMSALRKASDLRRPERRDLVHRLGQDAQRLQGPEGLCGVAGEAEVRAPTRHQPALLVLTSCLRLRGRVRLLRTLRNQGASRRRVIILVKAGSPVDSTIDGLMEFMEPGDIIIDGGNEWCAAGARRMH